MKQLRVAAEGLQRASLRLAPLMLGLGIVAATGLMGGTGFEREVTLTLVLVVVVIGLYTFIGMTGVLSFGHIAFMAIGAYVTALLTVPVARKEVLLPNLPAVLRETVIHPLAAAFVAGLIAALFGALIGIPLMRLSGLSAALAFLAVLLIVHTVAGEWETVTRGHLTMLGVPRETDLLRSLAFAWMAIVGAYVFSESRVGLRLRASRDDDAGAQAIGVNIGSDRRIALVVSGFIVGIGVFLYGQFLGSFNPDTFFLTMTFITVAMLVVGGMNTLSGAVLGTVVVQFVAALLRRIEAGFVLGPVTIPGRTGLREVGLAILMLVILLVRPGGLTGGVEVWRLRFGRKRDRWRADAERSGQEAQEPAA